MPETKRFLTNFLLLLFISTSTNGYHIQQKNKTQVRLFVFGDSLFDPGNSNFLNLTEENKANHWPYGETFFHFPTGRFCDGRIVPDFLALELGLPLWKPYLGPNGTHILSLKNGANFAGSGACVISTNQPNKVIDLPEQIVFMKSVAKELRQEQGETEANKTLMEAIYFSSIGGVDYLKFSVQYPNSTDSHRQQFVQSVVGNLTNVIKEIYEIGGRKFAFQSVGPLGCLPAAKQTFGLYDTDECVEELLDLSKRHNMALLETAHVLERTLQGFRFSFFNFYDTLYDVIKNHTKYGFKVADVACCGSVNGSRTCLVEQFELCKNVSEYVFFDGVHQTERVNVILSQLMWNGDTTIAVPRSFKQLAELNITLDDVSSYATKNVIVGIIDYVDTL